jgi:predicted nucleic acid-binding protein
MSRAVSAIGVVARRRAVVLRPDAVEHRVFSDPKLGALLQDDYVLAHPCVIGELALGQLSQRTEILGLLHNLPQANVATDAEVLNLIEARHLFGLGIGYVDAQLLAATMLTGGAGLWTRGKRLAAVAAELGLAGPAPEP